MKKLLLSYKTMKSLGFQKLNKFKMKIFLFLFALIGFSVSIY